MVGLTNSPNGRGSDGVATGGNSLSASPRVWAESTLGNNDKINTRAEKKRIRQLQVYE